MSAEERADVDYARREKIEAVAGKILAGDRRQVGDGRVKGLEGGGGGSLRVLALVTFCGGQLTLGQPITLAVHSLGLD